MTFHPEVLPSNSQKAISLLRNLIGINEFYLAGGTAVALYLGHRISGDLDFFAERDFNDSLLISRLSELGSFRLEKRAEQTVIGVFEKTKVSFIGYHYPLLFSSAHFGGVRLADIRDIACMKIDAISARGAKRDFIDLYFIIKETASLDDVLALFRKKYSSLEFNLLHIKKSLTYFDDADAEPMPKMLKPLDWKEVKSFFSNEAGRI